MWGERHACEAEEDEEESVENAAQGDRGAEESYDPVVEGGLPFGVIVEVVDGVVFDEDAQYEKDDKTKKDGHESDLEDMLVAVHFGTLSILLFSDGIPTSRNKSRRQVAVGNARAG